MRRSARGPALGRAGLLLLSVLGPTLLPAGLRAQQGCEWLPGTGDVSGQSLGGVMVTYASHPRLACRDGVRVVADSAVHYEASALYQLFGRVHFENPQMRLDANEAQYYSSAGRITAQGAVELLRKADSTLVTGENLDYTQASATNAAEQLTVTGGRPHAVLRPRARGEQAADTVTVTAPYEIDADRIFVRGEEEFQASGRVEIVRGDLSAFGEEAQYIGVAGQLVLNGSARLEADTYDLSGGMIVLEMPQDEVREVVARERAVLMGEDLTLQAPLIRLALTEGALDRVIASGAGVRAAPVAVPTDAPQGLREALQAQQSAEQQAAADARPLAIAQDFRITADSIEVLVPAEVLESVLAVGSARAVSTARDSLNTEATPEIARRDWIEGDTILAFFSPGATPPPEAAPTAEGEPEYRLDRMVARARARTLYRLPPADSAAAEASGSGQEGPRVAVHYVSGDSITIAFIEGEVESLAVVGQTRGLHLEPPGAAGSADAAEPAGADLAAPAPGASAGGGATPAGPDAPPSPVPVPASPGL